MRETCDRTATEHDDVVITAASELVDAVVGAAESRFVWGYYFCIENNSDEKITLLGKDWNITDERGNCFSDESEGFSGEIPELEPGEYFEFSATAPLTAANAVFYGSCKILKAGRKIVESIKLPVLEFNAAGASPSFLN